MATNQIELILDSSPGCFLDLCTQSPLISPVCLVHQRDIDVRFDYDRRTQPSSGMKRRKLHPLTSLCLGLRKYFNDYQDTGGKGRGNLDGL